LRVQAGMRYTEVVVVGRERKQGVSKTGTGSNAFRD
jgi:hypothetical protein